MPSGDLLVAAAGGRSSHHTGQAASFVEGMLWPSRGAANCRWPLPSPPMPTPLPPRIGLLGVGSNTAERRQHLQAAVHGLPAVGVRVLASSSLYDTDPVGEVL